MNAWIEHKAQRLLLAGALAFAVGAPTLACMGGDTASEDGADDAAPDAGDDGGEEAADAAGTMVGTWRVKPAEADLRVLKIINMAINNPKANEQMLQKKIKPPPSAEEIAMFNELKKADPNSPEVEFARLQIQMMREARLEIDDKKWTLDLAGEKQSYSYKVKSSSEDEVVVELDTGETNTLRFSDDDNCTVEINTNGQTMELQFARA